MYILAIPFGKSFDDIGFHYKVPEKLIGNFQLGQIIEVPFGKSTHYAVAYRETTKPEREIKDILTIIYEIPIITGYRLELIDYISKNYFTPIHNSLSLFVPKNLLQKAISGKLIFKSKKDFHYTTSNIKLSNEQEDVYNQISNSDLRKFILYGVTGSGKTEIYIKLIQKSLEKNKQSLLLIPEIILTNQISTRLKTVFGSDLLVLNSTVTQAKKTQYFIDIALSNAKIIIGTRSALFYPYKDLDLIIIDEEHDLSYISDQAPRYSAVEVAEKITELNGNTLLLASGTPSINTIYKTKFEDYRLLNLTKKYKKKS